MKKIVFLIIATVMFIAQVTAQDGLSAIIIGSGSPDYNPDRASASVYITNGTTNILVDMGNGTQSNLEEAGIKVAKLNALLITHHHIDHNEEFVPLLIKKMLNRDKFQIVGTSGMKGLVDHTLEFYSEDINYRMGNSGRTVEDRLDDFTVTEVTGGESFMIGDIAVSCVEVPHTIHTVGYRFDYNGESIVVSGDLSYTEALPELAKDADFLIMDSGGMVYEGKKNRAVSGKKNGTNSVADNSGNRGNTRTNTEKVRPHATLDESSRMAAEANAKNLVYTHFTPGTVDEEASLELIRKNYGGNVIFSEDLIKIN